MRDLGTQIPPTRCQFGSDYRLQLHERPRQAGDRCEYIEQFESTVDKALDAFSKGSTWPDRGEHRDVGGGGGLVWRAFARRSSAPVPREPRNRRRLAVLGRPTLRRGRLARGLWHQGQADEVLLKRLLQNHAKYAGSAQAARVLDGWSEYRGKFVKIFPHEYRRALGDLAAKSGKRAA